MSSISGSIEAAETHGPIEGGGASTGRFDLVSLGHSKQSGAARPRRDAYLRLRGLIRAGEPRKGGTDRFHIRFAQ
jgi:hypothetical protein